MGYKVTASYSFKPNKNFKLFKRYGNKILIPNH